MLNKATIIGRLVADPEIKLIKEVPCANFKVAADTMRKDSDGNKLTNFYNVSAWRGLSDVASKYLHKGEKVCVIGDILIRDYTDQSGQARRIVEITATDIDLIQPRDQNAANPTSPAVPSPSIAKTTPVEEEGLPF